VETLRRVAAWNGTTSILPLIRPPTSRFVRTPGADETAIHACPYCRY
jgi:hypothetical protein